MTADEMTVRRAVAEALGLAEIPPDAGLGRTLGWDSLAHIQVILALQRQLGLHIAPDLVGELTDVPAILRYLQETQRP